MVVLMSSIYGYYKINNRNAFEEMYNSYYNLLPLGAVDNMPQIKPIPRDEKHLDSVDLNYKNNTEDVIINIFQPLLSFFIKTPTSHCIYLIFFNTSLSNGISDVFFSVI